MDGDKIEFVVSVVCENGRCGANYLNVRNIW